jgi:predicted ester cyclase
VEDNKTVAERLYEDVYNARNIDALDEIAVDDYVEHDPLPGQGTGLSGLKDRAKMLIEGFDPHFTIEDVITEGDKVVVRWTNSGRHVGEVMGIPPTQREFTMAGIDIHRVAGGKLAEHWHVVDMLSQMQQLGLVPSPGGGE